MRQIDRGHFLEQLGGEMRCRADARRCEGDLAGIGLGVIDELLQRVHRRVLRHPNEVRIFAEQRDRHKVAHRIVVERRIEHRHDRQRRRAEQHRVAVGRGVGGGVMGDVAACAALVLDDDLLAPYLRQAAGGDARGRVGPAARREADDQPHHARRPGLCRGEASKRRSGGP
jgi:hypothetical protein